MSPVPSDGGLDIPAAPKERRFKLSRACDRCRRRRIKCDEGHPCQSCLSSHSACTFEEHGKRTHNAKSKRTATLEERMHHLETFIQSLPTTVFDSRSPSDLLQSPVSPVDEPSSPNAPSFPTGGPPPSLSVSTLTNPSTHFSPSALPVSFTSAFAFSPADKLADSAARPSLSPSYMYLDEQGCKRWQGETSGLPLLDLLFEQSAAERGDWSVPPSPLEPDDAASGPSWFPDRVPRRIDVNPETLWKVITSCISPDLMDTLVQCYLSTSYYLMPFLHVPTFLADYGNPIKWGEPGFASFILAICCLASRHTDDPRVRSDLSDPGARWFELFSRLRTLPTADRPTLYTVQAVLLAAVYAVGLGKLSTAFALLAEAVTLSFDAGLHRANPAFDPLAREVRTRTFWAVYLWDKQAAAAFGRPPLLRLRDCDVPEPAPADDDFLPRLRPAAPAAPPPPAAATAFVAALRYYVVLEAVLAPPRAAPLRDEERALAELRRALPAHWVHTPDTPLRADVRRVTQTVRLHCLERFVALLIHRHRFAACLAARAAADPAADPAPDERDALRAAYVAARELVAAHLHTAAKALVSYYGVHAIHQLTQAGRTLAAVVLAAPAAGDDLRAPALDVLRSCVALLRRFGARYACALRAGDLLEDFCRLSQIPLDAPRPPAPWLRKPARTPPAPCSAASTPPDFLDVPAATPRSLSPASPDGAFADVDMDAHFAAAPPELFGADEVARAGLVALFQEGSFDVAALFPPGGALDMFPGAAGPDGIIATP